MKVKWLKIMKILSFFIVSGNPVVMRVSMIVKRRGFTLVIGNE